jgi:hypothetical protein
MQPRQCFTSARSQFKQVRFFVELTVFRVQKVWAISDFARHYFRNRGFFLFLQVLRWFTSLSSLVPDYEFIGPYTGFTGMGFPIRRSPGLNACLRLPEAYRSLPRPSSPSSAKASTMRP